MNVDLLHDILRETTIQLRKGAEVTQNTTPGGLAVTEVFAMPHVNEARPDLELVDMEFLTIGVDKVKAKERKSELIAILREYPEPERLAGGPSYIEVGAEMGQGAAFQLFALGKVVGLWDVITPTKLGFTGEEAREMATGGFIMITGFSAP